MGFTITPDGWNKTIDITASSRILSSLGRNQIKGGTNTGDNVTITAALTRPSTGGMYLCVPTKACAVTPVPQNGVTNVNCLRGAYASGGTLVLNAYHHLPVADSSSVISYDISSFEVPAAQAQTYGIALTDATDFCAISDISRFGYVTYRDTITVNGAWTLPTSIPNRESCVVFARWNDAGTPVYFDRDSLQIRTYTGFGSADGSVQGGTVSNIQIVVVSTGVTPPIPSSGYGTVIRNATNQITFSSAWPPVIWRGGTFTFGFYIQTTTGSSGLVSWVGAAGNVALPMVPLGSYGFQCGDWASTGTYPMRKTLLSGLLMSGNSVSTYRAKPGQAGDIYFNSYPSRGQAGITIPCIDAADYF